MERLFFPFIIYHLSNYFIFFSIYPTIIVIFSDNCLFIEQTYIYISLPSLKPSAAQVCEDLPVCDGVHVLPHQHGHRRGQIQSHRQVPVPAGGQ